MQARGHTTSSSQTEITLSAKGRRFSKKEEVAAAIEAMKQDIYARHASWRSVTETVDLCHVHRIELLIDSQNNLND